MTNQKDWSKDPKGAYEFIFNTHFWGDRTNSGRKVSETSKLGNYKRRYSKTKKDKGLIKVDNRGYEIKGGKND